MRPRPGMAIACVVLVLACGGRPSAHSPVHASGGSGGSASGGHLPDACRGQVLTGLDGCLDFGTVMLGHGPALPLELANPGDRPLDVCAGVLERGFTVEPERVQLPAGGTGTLNVRFRAAARGSHEAYLQLRSCVPCPDPLGAACLRAEGVVEDFAMEPSRVSFGSRAPGTTTCQEIRVANTGDVSLHVRDVQMDDGLTRTPGTFELKLGGMLDDSAIPPGASAAFELCFSPSKGGIDFAGNLYIRTDGPVDRLPVTGRGAAVKVVPTPSSLDFGTVRAALAHSAGITFRNVGDPLPVDVLSVDVTPAAGPVTIHAPALPFDVGANDFIVGVRFWSVREGAFQASVTLTIRDAEGVTEVVVPVTALVVSASK